VFQRAGIEGCRCFHAFDTCLAYVIVLHRLIVIVNQVIYVVTVARDAIDWQKQSTEPGTNYVEEGYDQRNTGVYLTGLQQLGDFTLEGAVRSDDNSQFGRHGTWQSSAGWEFIEGYRFIASYGTAYKAPNLGQLYGFYGNDDLNPEESKQWEGAFEGPG